MTRSLGMSLLVIAAILVVVLSQSLFTVNERQQALVLRFGEIVSEINEQGQREAGLHFKIPFVDQVVFYDKRNLEHDMRPAEILGADQERLVVDAFLRYRIVNPRRFYQTVRNEEGGRIRLSAIMDDSLRGVIASVTSSEVISGRRSELMTRIQAAVEGQVNTQDLGIEVVDVRILRADLPPQIADRVYQRMRSEREQEAGRIRAEGDQAAEEIRADANRQARIVIAEANADAERIQGEGDAQRNAIFAAAYGRDPEFFAFYRSMLAYEQTLRDGTPIILPPDSEFFRYFRNEDGFAPNRR